MSEDYEDWPAQFDRMSPCERWASLDNQTRLTLLTLWGMRPGWEMPPYVQACLGVTYTQTTARLDRAEKGRTR